MCVHFLHQAMLGVQLILAGWNKAGCDVVYSMACTPGCSRQIAVFFSAQDKYFGEPKVRVWAQLQTHQASNSPRGAVLVDM